MSKKTHCRATYEAWLAARNRTPGGEPSQVYLKAHGFRDDADDPQALAAWQLLRERFPEFDWEVVDGGNATKVIRATRYPQVWGPGGELQQPSLADLVRHVRGEIVLDFAGRGKNFVHRPVPGEAVDHLLTVTDGIPSLNLGDFVSKMQVALPALLAFLRSDELRDHPVWGSLLPYDVGPYGTDESVGHIVRPDIILTAEGPRVCELDFVPSGRGWVYASLMNDGQRRRFLEPFRSWYTGMGANDVVYATATTTTCWEETVLFSAAMREIFGFSVTAVNMDEDEVNGQLVDRLFYRAEMREPHRAEGKQIITAEPWLDSKLVFALVHDPGMTEILEAAIGAENLTFLREAFIETWSLNMLRADQHGRDFLREVARNRAGYLVKNADVESHECWGSRGVVLGRKYTRSVFDDALLYDRSPNGKVLGSRPVLQRFMRSLDFTSVWNAIIDGSVNACDQGQMGKEVDPKTQRPARGSVYARVGAYFLLDNRNRVTHVPPFGVLTLRQDELAHGATDARLTAFELVGS